MGFGLPAAIALSLLGLKRGVAIVGDGGFQMTMPELTPPRRKTSRST